MSLMDGIKRKAQAAKKRIKLPEGTEERTLKAAEIIAREGIADVTLLGDVEKIKELSKGLNLKGVGMIDPAKSDKLEVYAEKFY
jgi:phosphate acetyltransferase